MSDAVPGPGECVVWVDRTPFGPGWLLLKSPLNFLEGSAPAVIKEIARSRGGLAVGFLSYHASAEFEPAVMEAGSGELPSACFAIYPTPVPFFKELPQATSGFPEFTPEIDKAHYACLFDRVKQELAAGNSYQVNLTWRLRAASEDSLWQAFCNAVADDPPPYAAFLNLGGVEVASFSPELFFTRRGDSLTCRPMKGTAPRGATPKADEALARTLRESPKELAENLMIVDMVRNDLGRIARPGTVRVTKLFEVERHPDQLQMTSTIVAESDVELPDVMRALFPCASIIGAPKIATQRILTEIEPSMRGLYTGAIGLVLPNGDAQFSVAIRTAVRNPKTNAVEYGIGGGIVWDSNVESEWQECLLKASPLTRISEPWALLETLLWDGAEFRRLEGHEERMRRSAHELGVPFDRDVYGATLYAAVDNEADRRRVRLLLSREGHFLATSGPIQVLDGPLMVGFAPERVWSGDPELRHKTNRRRMYERQQAARPDCHDLILFNERDEATEFLIGNLAAKIKDEWVTPSLACGVLPGVERAALLIEGKIQERVLTHADILRAAEIVRINSVSGWRTCQLSPY